MSDSPQISGFQVRPVVVPLNPPLRTASGVMAKAPLVLVDISTNAGVTGSAYIFTYTPCGPAGRGRSAQEPAAAA
ncbi:hypothetical protein [Cupriavidus sp. WS]|uniref:hypothetical protein n=1 Tax=Cupriavidus sp. WS TaxID=1312922 RepID=UPI0009DBC847|nr:hypothetical protein [Cupriavidus sp. WS]